MLKGPFQRSPGRGGPGGWWILTEVESELETHEVYRPDLAKRGERARAEPFEQVELNVGLLFGDEEA